MTTPARFLERWSRLKRRGDSAPASAGVASDEIAPGEEAAAPAEGSLPAEAGEPHPGAARGADALSGPAAAASLPPIETLDLDADFTGFLKKEVGEPLRRAALRKLFSDPHFNRMDGLDTYIGDYSAADPIPPDIMKRLRQFKTFLEDDSPPAEPVGAIAELSAPGDPVEARQDGRGATAPGGEAGVVPDGAEDRAPPEGGALRDVGQIAARATNPRETK